MKRVFLIIQLSFFAFKACAIEWKLSKENDHLKIYTAKVENSKFKSVKVECVVSARLSQVVSVFFDIEGQQKWIYGDKISNVLKKESDTEFYYYSEVSVPWPFDNRDFIAHVKATHPSAGKVIIESYGVPGYLPEKKGIVRVQNSSSYLELTAVNNNTTSISYMIQFDPGGEVPSWITNLFVTKGPYVSFEKLPDLLKLPEYQKNHLAFLE